MMDFDDVVQLFAGPVFLSTDSLPSRCSRLLDFGYEPSWSVVIEDGSQLCIVVNVFSKTMAARVFRPSANMKSIRRRACQRSETGTSTGATHLTLVSSTRQEVAR